MADDNLGKRLQQEKQPVNPFVFLKDGEGIKPFVDVKSTIDTPTRFAILRTTENGKYVRGNKLYFKLNGVEIYTDINNIIFVDTESNTYIVETGEKILDEVSPNNPKEKQYVILIKSYNEDESYIWEAITGRMETYNYIVENIEDINPKESIILTDNVALKDALTIEQFVKHVQSVENIDDGFDIEDYIYEFYN